ncbi:MAG: hypothetical protein A2X83_02315 [Desulfuromonadales bacterium GWD2_54_10]|nr:MAG: hypothetical protein A2X83_02315 [Desulfuromonadales bacterium GWD2_54_10]
MDCLRTKPIGSVLKRTMLMVVLGLLLCPAAIYAESLKLFYTVDKDALKPGTVSKINKKPAELLPFLGVDKGGDVVIRNGNVSLVMAYNSADDVHRFQDRVRDIQPLERPIMNGISLTICCVF